jgi:hypothetical protein
VHFDGNQAAMRQLGVVGLFSGRLRLEGVKHEDVDMRSRQAWAAQTSSDSVYADKQEQVRLVSVHIMMQTVAYCCGVGVSDCRVRARSQTSSRR